MVKMRVHGEYQRSYTKLLQDEPGIESLVDAAVSYFRKNPSDTRIENHELHGRLRGKWAFSVTDDIRIVYEWLGKMTVRYLAIGKHPTVYPKSRIGTS